MSFIKEQLNFTLNKFDIEFGEKNYSGKVRENFYFI